MYACARLRVPRMYFLMLQVAGSMIRMIEFYHANRYL
jgi:hypothetical protein